MDASLLFYTFVDSTKTEDAEQLAISAVRSFRSMWCDALTRQDISCFANGNSITMLMTQSARSSKLYTVNR